MARPALKSLMGTIAGATALSLVSIGTAQAAVLNYAFQVRINQGPYQGTHTGAFRFDNASLSPCAVPPLNRPEMQCATPSDSGLSVIFNFLGRTYTNTSDFQYTPEAAKFPALYYYPELENVPAQWQNIFSPYLLSLIVMQPQTTENFAILGNQFFMGFSTIGQINQGTNIGEVFYFRLPTNNPQPPSPCLTNPSSCQGTAVPEPTEIAGTVMAAGILGWLWRSRRHSPLKR